MKEEGISLASLAGSAFLPRTRFGSLPTAHLRSSLTITTRTTSNLSMPRRGDGIFNATHCDHLRSQIASSTVPPCTNFPDLGSSPFHRRRRLRLTQERWHGRWRRAVDTHIQVGDMAVCCCSIMQKGVGACSRRGRLVLISMRQKCAE
jgi:hypothetical protein